MKTAYLGPQGIKRCKICARYAHISFLRLAALLEAKMALEEDGTAEKVLGFVVKEL